MIIRTQENYKTDAGAIVWFAIDLLIFVLTLFNILAGTYLRRENFFHNKPFWARFFSKWPQKYLLTEKQGLNHESTTAI